jgi:hypothetical protein
VFDHEIRIEIARERAAQLQRAWYPTANPARYAFGSWLIRLGRVWPLNRLGVDQPSRMKPCRAADLGVACDAELGGRGGSAAAAV